MKIAIRGGHNYGVTGANGIVNEVAEDRKIYIKVIDYLKQLGHEVLDVTPNRTITSAEDLIYGVSRANNWGADYFVSIHLNAGGGRGTEALYQTEKGQIIAARISARISELGFNNRGPKPNARGLYELKYTKMTANIIECFFCDSQADTDLYNKIGVDKLALAIAEGITDQTLINKKVKNAVVYGNSVDKRAAEYLADFLQCSVLDGNNPYDYSDIESVYCVGGEPKGGWTSYCTKKITGSDRYETIKEVLRFIGRL